MVGDRQSHVTTLLYEVRAGNPDAPTKLLEVVYDELRVNNRREGKIRPRGGQT